MTTPTPFDKYKQRSEEDELVASVTADIIGQLMRKADVEAQEPDNSNVYQLSFGKKKKKVWSPCVFRLYSVVARCPHVTMYDRNRLQLSTLLKV